MKHVFVSYKREDEKRTAPLLRALEEAGFSVWWDRSIAIGDDWRQQIETALAAAGCVVVLWTHDSVGPGGRFVREEANEALQRGILVPVLRDKVKPPLGFREIQAIDLVRWNGSPRDAFFKDLCAAVHAKLEGRMPPPAKGPTKRLMRRVGGSLSTLLAVGLMAAFSQDLLCKAPIFQPFLSDQCGALGLGRTPTREERIAWESRAPRSCAALKAHLERFPGGAYRNAAQDILAARKTTQREGWSPAMRRLTLFVPTSDAASSNRSGAQAVALARAQTEAEALCRGFAGTTLFKFISAKASATSYSCQPSHGGVTCNFSGNAVCEVLERTSEDDDVCGS